MDNHPAPDGPSQLPAVVAPPAVGQPLPGQRFCAGCGTPVVTTAVICPKCGTAMGSPRNKGIAILLAVFLSFWTWVYTYKKDATKFWIGLVLAVVGFISAFFLVGWFLLVGLWIWAIVDTATKPEAYYQRYPEG